MKNIILVMIAINKIQELNFAKIVFNYKITKIIRVFMIFQKIQN